MSIQRVGRTEGNKENQRCLLHLKRTYFSGQLRWGFSGLMCRNPEEGAEKDRSEDEQDNSELSECRSRSSSRCSSTLGISRRIGQRYAYGGTFWNIHRLRIVRRFDR